MPVNGLVQQCSGNIFIAGIQPMICCLAVVVHLYKGFI